MGGLFETLKKAWHTPDLRKRLLYTLAMIVLFRVGGNIPVPGIDRVAFTNLISRFGQLGSMMDIMSGGALAAVSIFAMGISPYINASIIMQLLGVGIPALERLSKQGEEGRKKIAQYTRYVTILLAIIQSVGIIINQESPVFRMPVGVADQVIQNVHSVKSDGIKFLADLNGIEIVIGSIDIERQL